MLSPPSRRSPTRSRSPLSSPLSINQTSTLAARRSSLEERRRPAANFAHTTFAKQDIRIQEDEGEDDGDFEDEDEGDEHDNDEEAEDEDGDGEEEEDDDHAGETSPLLPIFSAAHLDSLPVYNLTHTIRLLVVPRCETTLSWDQLRSPQVSQFLVKPIQQQIRDSHFSKATLYALMSNCLQFNREIQNNPGNSGVSKTRSLVCELLAMKLLKEFSTRDLIDALSYDFDPLQGLTSKTGNETPGPNWDVSGARSQAHSPPRAPRAARVSTIEVAIRAQSKKFLAHPLVVQQLEAIWAGTIVFHSAADTMHRAPVKVTPNQNRGYGTGNSGEAVLRASPNDLQPAKQRDHLPPTIFSIRRSATLYDPRDASLFKLSRLRVPRYRQVLSTCSLAVLLGLYLTVLIERSLHISALEVVFWFWSAGFMLDEVVGFNEQGFSLYIMSFWNTFDVGILLLLICYYCMRLYGILMPDVRKRAMADMAYDVLAADAVLLFPRLFSVLDHYRYFSQLLIAFRMMAEDLMAVFILIIISCSGFFVAFTLSFSDADVYDAPGVAYALFQILMGFTPAAWQVWPTYNILGKIILTMFLFISQFLIVTILITVLTNSFMAIVQNANEEHQFVFAVNTISMVKSDALFSYVAPTNIISWLLAPLRFVLPFRRFVKINRTTIKITHFPILFLIYAYERMILGGRLFDAADAVEQRGRKLVEDQGSKLTGAHGLRVMSPKHGRLREPSIATFRKDRALEEVFRRPFRDNTVRGTQLSRDRRKASNVVNGWMSGMGSDGMPSPPPEQDHSVIDRLEARRIAHRRSQQVMRRRRMGLGRNITEGSMSIASDPEDLGASSIRIPRSLRRQESSLPAMSVGEAPQTEAGEVEEAPSRYEEAKLAVDRLATPQEQPEETETEQEADYFQQTPRARPAMSRASTSAASNPPKKTRQRGPSDTKLASRRPRYHHARNLSTNTILYDPRPNAYLADATNITIQPPKRPNVNNSGNHSPKSGSQSTPKRPVEPKRARARPVMPPRSLFQSAPNLAGMLMLGPQEEKRTAMALDIGSDLGDNKAVGGGFIGGYPASLATRMAYGTGDGHVQRRQTLEGHTDAQSRMSKLMLARMNTLEEGFREVLQEVRGWKRELNGDSIERKSLDGADLVEMKIGRPRSKNAPLGGLAAKGKMKLKVVGRGEDEWVDDDNGDEAGRDGGKKDERSSV